MDSIQIQQNQIQQEIWDDFHITFSKACQKIEIGSEKIQQIFGLLMQSQVGNFLQELSHIFEKFTQKNLRDSKDQNDNQEIGECNYENLEKVLQKYEAEIREHVRLEQQLKIYAESLEEKITLLKSQNNEKHSVQNLLKENKMLIQKNIEMQKKNQQLKKKFKNEYLTKNVSFQNKRNQSLESVIQKECFHCSEKQLPKQTVRNLLQLFQWGFKQEIFKQTKIKTVL